MNTQIKITVVVLLTMFVSACGGGGSSSGGSAVPGTPADNLTYRGTYDARGYAGSITIQINGSVPTVTLTGVPCLQAPFSNGLSTSVSGVTRVVGGQIAGQPADSEGSPASINLTFPNTGPGAGDITLSPGGACFPVVGVVNITEVI